MRRFWNDVREHRLASGMFLAYWLAAYLLHILRWHAPKNLDDMIPPVLLLHTLLPVAGGALAAWWHGPRPGRIGRGMAAGAAIVAVDFALIGLKEALVSSPAGGGEGFMELPAFFTLAAVVGAALGCGGALAAAAKAGPIPPADRIYAALPRRALVTAAALAGIAALLIFAAVIPPVRADVSPTATPDRAVPAFEIIAVLNLYAAFAWLAALAAQLGRVRRPLAAMAGLLAIALGAVLAAAGSAGFGHVDMKLGSVACLACAAADLVAGVVGLRAALTTGGSASSSR